MPSKTDVIAEGAGAAVKGPREFLGWALEKSIKCLASTFKDIKHYSDHLAELLSVLESGRLHKTAAALDKITDHPDFADWRGEYKDLCGYLEEAHSELLSAQLPEPVNADEQTGVCSRPSKTPKLHPKIGYNERVQKLTKSLNEFCTLKKIERLDETVKKLPTPTPRRIQLQDRVPALRERGDPAAAAPLPRNTQPEVVQHIFQHCSDLVPQVEGLLATIENVALTGMGGIGKTTIAGEVFERAKSKFNKAVWLTVGKDAPDMYSLLRIAFRRLYPNDKEPFEGEEKALSDLAQRLKNDNQSVLLVLDDVWLSDQHAVVSALNFATRTESMHKDSRLLVTTRERKTLSYNPSVTPWQRMDDLHVVEVQTLSPEHARELFYHNAFGSSDAKLPEHMPPDVCAQLIKECGGNPLALTVLAKDVGSSSSAVQWQHRLAKFREKQDNKKDTATVVCATSVEALPPSLRECFIDFAAFVEDERVPEADLVHLFAMHAPLHTPQSVDAAAQKLLELVDRSIVSVTAVRHGDFPSQGPLYYMHDILHSLAQEDARAPDSGRCFHAKPDDRPKHSTCRFLSTDAANLFPQMTISKSGEVNVAGAPEYSQLRTCNITFDRDLASQLSGKIFSLRMPWLRYLRINDVAAKVPRQTPPLKFLKLLGSHHLREFPLLEELLKMPDVPLQHLDLGYNFMHTSALSNSLSQISCCSQLTALILRGPGLQCLPGGVKDCCELRYLDLSHNYQLTTLSNIGHLSQLRHLNLHGCYETTKIPKELGDCVQLQHLDLGGCTKLTCLEDGSIGRCRQLLHLHLHDCSRLTHLPIDICSCSQLQHLSLNRGRALKKLPEDIGGCCEVQVFDFSVCPKLRGLPDSITRCSKLQYLYLNDCTALQHLPKTLAGCIQLRHLDLEDCPGLTHLPEDIGECKHLSHLSFSRSIYSVFSDKHIDQVCLPKSIVRCSQLQHLTLKNWYPFNQPLPASSAVIMNDSTCQSSFTLALARLWHLDLAGCQQLIHLPNDIGKWNQLSHLNLQFCSNLTHLPDSIGCCTQLQHLNLKGCKRLTCLPKGLFGCTQLTLLSLARIPNLTHLSEDIGHCGQLQCLNLELCLSLKSIPANIGGCTKLRSIALQGNIHIIQLLDSLTRCSQVQGVSAKFCDNLAHLPKDMGCMTQLRRLRLEGCRSVTHLPESIARCSKLELLCCEMSISPGAGREHLSHAAACYEANSTYTEPNHTH